MVTLGRLIDRLEPVLTAIDVPAAARDTPVTGIAIFDGSDPGEAGVGEFVLAVGADDLSGLAARRPAAVVVRGDAPAVGGLAVLALREDGSWLRLIELVSQLLTSDENAPASFGAAADDLFSVADAIAAMVDGPVTIEDTHANVLAFSQRQEGADAARLATIVGRKGPSEYVERMRERGVFKRVREATGPIFVAGRPPDILPRVVAPVRASGELLGSVWVVVRNPPTPEQEQALAGAAPMVALHLLRHRALSDARRSEEIDAASRILDGRAGAMDAARRFGLVAPSYAVIAASAADAEPSKLWDVLRLQLMSARGRSLVAQLRETVYGIVALQAPASGRRVEPSVRGFIERLADEACAATGADVRIGIGEPAVSLDEVPRAAREAERVLDVLRPPLRVADVVDAGAELLVRGAVDAMDARLGSAALERLFAHDREHGTAFVETVDAYLDRFGSTERTASALGVHANTVRYRIRQIAELGLADLDDPDERLALTLHLRRRRRDAPPAAATAAGRPRARARRRGGPAVPPCG